MSGYEPMLSDEVEVVVRGRVTARYSSTGRFDVDDLHSIHPDHVVSVGKVEPPKPPLPTTPGSVIHYIGDPDEKYMRRSDGQWVCVDGVVRDRPLIPSVYVTEYDAGAES